MFNKRAWVSGSREAYKPGKCWAEYTGFKRTGDGRAFNRAPQPSDLEEYPPSPGLINLPSLGIPTVEMRVDFSWLKAGIL
jgi:hypothetical protein